MITGITEEAMVNRLLYCNTGLLLLDRMCVMVKTKRNDMTIIPRYACMNIHKQLFSMSSASGRAFLPYLKVLNKRSHDSGMAMLYERAKWPDILKI